MAGRDAIPTALHVLLCTAVRIYDSELAIIGGGLRVYPSEGPWFLAGTYDGPGRTLNAQPGSVALLHEGQQLWQGSLVIKDAPDSDDMVRLPLAVQLPRVLDDAQPGVYFVRVALGGKTARLPIMVPERANEPE